MFYRRHFLQCQKRGSFVGKTKRGKGTKIMAIADQKSLPIAIGLDSASPHEVTLVEKTLKQKFTKGTPKRLIGDRAYDSDPLDQSLKKKGIDLIAPHKSNRKKKVTQDGRKLRRYKRRWKVEKLNAWLQQFRRLVVRYEYYASHFLAFVQLACIRILLRNYF
jgi:transposase